MPKAGWPCFSAIELINIFVDVPIKVHTPPNIEAKDSGISKRDGLLRILEETATTIGKNIATAAVLLINADRRPITPIKPSKSTA